MCRLSNQFGKFSIRTIIRVLNKLINKKLINKIKLRRKENPGRTLTCDEHSFFANYFPSEILDSIIVYVGKVPWWLRKDMAGVTLRNKIYLRAHAYVPNTASGMALLGHEITHVQQFFEGMNYRKYLWSCRKGYCHSPYEIEAYATGAAIRNDFVRENTENFNVKYD